jgi:hypothetical protein
MLCGKRVKRLKVLCAAGILFSLLSFPISSAACSYTSCLGDGVELRGDFRVDVKHGGKPLPGVSIRVTRNAEDDSGEALSGITTSDGTLRIENLPSGKYWLNAELLGIDAGSQCFHVAPQPSRNAKTKIKYDWGDLVPASRHIEGRFVYAEPGQGGNRLWNFMHQVEVPINAASLTLSDPFSSKTYSINSDNDGHFSFGGVPDGLYVLHIQGGIASGGRSYESANLLIRLSKTANSDALLLKRTIADFGGCGGVDLELESKQS